MQQFETLTQDQINRRAGGRRHYNSIRAFRRSMRRAEIIKWWRDNGGGLTDWGTQKRLAAKWDVSTATICRDVSAILQTGLLCDKCGQSRPVVGQ